jgi:hypothetical protein
MDEPCCRIETTVCVGNGQRRHNVKRKQFNIATKLVAVKRNDMTEPSLGRASLSWLLLLRASRPRRLLTHRYPRTIFSFALSAEWTRTTSRVRVYLYLPPRSEHLVLIFLQPACLSSRTREEEAPISRERNENLLTLQHFFFLSAVSRCVCSWPFFQIGLAERRKRPLNEV